MNQILDSQGRPVRIVSHAAKTSFENRGPSISAPSTNAGMTMLSKFSGRGGNSDISKFQKLAADVQNANPSIRSPLLNQSNFYMPESDSSTGEPNRLLNQWITYYMKFHHMIGNVITLHSELPLSRFALRGISDPTVLRYYEEMTESMELHSKSIDILKQYFGYGEAIPFAHWSDNYNCFTDLTLLDPNYVYVKGHYLLHSEDGDDTEFYELEPDPLLCNIVKSDDYVNKLLAANLDPEFISAVQQNKRVLLSNFSTHMIKDRLKYSDLRGTSIVLRCFVEDTQVFLSNGTFKLIQEIEPDDLVITHKNRLQPVKAVFRRKPEKDEKVVAVTLNGQRVPIKCSDQHEFLVWTGARTCPCGCGRTLTGKQLLANRNFALACGRRWKYVLGKKGTDPKDSIDPTFEWKKIADLEPGDYLCVQQGRISTEIHTPTDMNENRARLLGYFLAEGCFVKNKTDVKIKKAINFTFHIDEQEYRDDVVTLIQTEFGLQSYIYEDKEQHSCIIRSEWNEFVAEWMFKYANEYSSLKTLPEDILFWEASVLKQICIGFLRGDGSWNDGRVTYTSVSNKLSAQIQSILFVLGVPSCYDITNNTIRNKKDGCNRKEQYRRVTILKTNSDTLSWLDSTLGYKNTDKESKYAPLVKFIIDSSKQGLSDDAICSILNKEGKTTLRGKSFYRELIGRITHQGSYDISGRKSGNREKIVGDYLVRQIRSINKIEYTGYLYNLNVVEDHSYVVNDHVIAKNCLKSLLYSDKLRESSYSVADGNINPKWIWKIGQAGDLTSGGYMPTEEDLMAFRDLLLSASNDPLFTIITHYAVNVDAVGLNGKLLPITGELNQIENELLSALFCNKAMTTGEGPNFSTASIAFRTLMSRYIPIRAKLERYFYQKLFAPVAYANKFYERKQCDLAHGVRTGDADTNKLIIPTIDWRSKSNLLDDGSIKSIISSMVGSGRLPMKILTEALDLDYTEVRDYLYKEQGTVFDGVTIEGRKKLGSANTDETMMGQPFAPKENQPVSLKNARGQGAIPKAAKASKEIPLNKFANLLSIKAIGTTDPIQTQINKGKPEKGGNPEMPDPMKESLKLAEKVATSASTTNDIDAAKVSFGEGHDNREFKQMKPSLVEAQFARHAAKERYKVVEGSKEPLKNDFMKVEPYPIHEPIVVSAEVADSDEEGSDA